MLFKRHFRSSVLLMILMSITMSVNGQQNYSNTRITTNGLSLAGNVRDERGRIVGETEMYADGDSKTIYINSNQDLLLKDDDGNYSAGYVQWATNPMHYKLTQLFIYRFKENGKRERYIFEQQYNKVELRGGILKVEGGDKQLQIKAKDEHIATAQLVKLENKKGNSKRMNVSITFSLSKELSMIEKILKLFGKSCNEFTFDVDLEYKDIFFLSDDDGHFAKCIKKI